VSILASNDSMLARQIRMPIGTLDSRGRGRFVDFCSHTIQTPLVVPVAENKMQLRMALATG